MVVIMKVSEVSAVRNRSSGVEDAIVICKARAQPRDVPPQPQAGCNWAGVVRRRH